MITVGKLAEMFGLSRTTLLYYDRIKLLSPTTRTRKGYRLYGEDRVAELRLICTYKSVGLTLNEIRELLAKPGEPDKGILRKRIIELDKEISNLRNQQRALADLLRNVGDIDPTGSLDKDTWVEILRSSGMDQSDMQRWHTQFERNAPEAHHSFLRWLGIPEKEALEIRAGSKD
jgi:DNA-binding transcriptional MerR regulator